MILGKLIHHCSTTWNTKREFFTESITFKNFIYSFKVFFKTELWIKIVYNIVSTCRNPKVVIQECESGGEWKDFFFLTHTPNFSKKNCYPVFERVSPVLMLNSQSSSITSLCRNDGTPGVCVMTSPECLTQLREKKKFKTSFKHAF